MVWTNRGVSSDGGDLCKLHEDDEIATPSPFLAWEMFKDYESLGVVDILERSLWKGGLV